MDVAAEIARVLSHLREPCVLDVGCGTGLLAKALETRASAVVGVDPSLVSIAAARRNAPEATFVVGTAEDLPFRACTFDAVVILNALHHLPDPRRGLLEARRVARSGSPVVVVEPLAQGSFFEALRCVDDETDVRVGAQRILRDMVDDGTFSSKQGYVSERVDRFADLDAFLARAVAVDRARAIAVEARRPQMAEAFACFAERDAGGYRLRQPLRIDVLLVPGGDGEPAGGEALAR